MTPLNNIEEFLLKNGFEKRKHNKSLLRFENKRTTVIIVVQSDFIVVDNIKTNESYYSESINLFWLIEVLTYYDLINKDYKI